MNNAGIMKLPERRGAAHYHSGMGGRGGVGFGPVAHGAPGSVLVGGREAGSIPAGGRRDRVKVVIHILVVGE